MDSLPLQAQHLVFTSDKDRNIHSGGFSINSIFMKQGISPIKTFNNNTISGGGSKVSDLFDNLVVPSWILSYDSVSGPSINNLYNINEIDGDDDYIDESLHDKLYQIMQPTKQKFTKHKKKKSYNKTKKYLKGNN
jgi:hypothetical protein